MHHKLQITLVGRVLCLPFSQTIILSCTKLSLTIIKSIALYHQHQNTSLYLSRTPLQYPQRAGCKSSVHNIILRFLFLHDHLFSSGPDLPMRLEDGPLTPIYFHHGSSCTLLEKSFTAQPLPKGLLRVTELSNGYCPIIILQ